MAAILTIAVLVCPSGPYTAFREIAWNSLCLGFANAHAIPGLALEGGHLHGARVDIMVSSEAEYMFKAIGTVQAILGPILLFLVLLTLRNRFRLG